MNRMGIGVGAVARWVRYRYYRGSRRLCPICGCRSRRFRAFGRPRRLEAQCGWCSSLERDRLMWLYVQKHTTLGSPPDRRMLHVAPEPCLEARFRGLVGAGYVTADLHSRRTDVRMDITDIPYPDATFDFIYCSHVLEHVADDRRAMREFRRVLKPDGKAVLRVPITSGSNTFEDPTVTHPSERARLFGQHDHVRRYGADYVDRLTAAGFAVEVWRIEDLASRSDAELMNLGQAAGQIHVCRHAR